MSFTAGAEGGEYKHSISVSELPAQEGNVQWHGAENGTCMWNASGVFGSASTVSNKYQAAHTANTGANSKMSLYYYNGGKNEAHNNIQPYIVVYFWKRTA